MNPFASHQRTAHLLDKRVFPAVPEITEQQRDPLRFRAYCGIGIDLESNRPIDDRDLCSLICRPEERSLVWSEGYLAKLLFVIKEAVFKAYYPGAAFFLEFSDVSVQIDAARRSFCAELMRNEAPPLAGIRRFVGDFRVCDDDLVATVLVRCR